MVLDPHLCGNTLLQDSNLEARRHSQDNVANHLVHHAQLDTPRVGNMQDALITQEIGGQPYLATLQDILALCQALVLGWDLVLTLYMFVNMLQARKYMFLS